MQISSVQLVGNKVVLYYDRPLIESKIIRRTSRFSAEVEVDGEVIVAHVPTTGRVAGMKIDGYTCLLSGPYDYRKTKYTVEAVSFWNNSEYVGINQTFSNRLIESALSTDYFKSKLGVSGSVSREVKVDNSRLDFKIGNSYLEVKTLVSHWYGYHKLPVETEMNTTSVYRMDKHINTLKKLVDTRVADKGILLSVFLYHAKPFTPPDDPNGIYDEFVKDIKDAVRSGVEMKEVSIELGKCKALVGVPYSSYYSKIMNREGELNDQA